MSFDDGIFAIGCHCRNSFFVCACNRVRGAKAILEQRRQGTHYLNNRLWILDSNCLRVISVSWALRATMTHNLINDLQHAAFTHTAEKETRILDSKTEIWAMD